MKSVENGEKTREEKKVGVVEREGRKWRWERVRRMRSMRALMDEENYEEDEDNN